MPGPAVDGRWAMHPQEAVRQVLAEHLPAAAGGSVRLLGAGQDNSAWLVDGTLVVRFGRDTDAVREAALLRTVAAVSPLPVPAPLFADAGRNCLAYPLLPGTPLAARPPGDRGAVVSALAALLTALWAASDRFAGLAPDDGYPPAAALAEARGSYAAVRSAIPAADRPAIVAFLRTDPPAAAGRLVFSHNDLGAEHVLTDDAGRISGVIDWSDAAFTDPAYDVGLLFRDLGPAALDAFDPALRSRAVFHARCSLLEDLAYGLAAGNAAYRDNALRSLEWTFADHVV